MQLYEHLRHCRIFVKSNKKNVNFGCCLSQITSGINSNIGCSTNMFQPGIPLHG